MNKIVARQNESNFHGDAGKLAEELRGKIRGEVRFDLGSRALCGRRIKLARGAHRRHPATRCRRRYADNSNRH
jgi:hypothetical protein